MIYFVGAGPGDPDLITVKGARLISEANLIVYAGSLVNPELLQLAPRGCRVYDSAGLTLEETIAIMAQAADQTVVRLHTGDPSLYGAIGEQMAELDRLGLPYQIIPGVTSAFAAAAAIGAELTVPEVSQTVIFTRIPGRTPVPPEQGLSSLAAHRATMAIFLSVQEADRVVRELLAGGYPETTPAAVVQRASWPEEVVIESTLADLAAKVKEAGIGKTAMILVGEALAAGGVTRSRLYHPSFSHEYRRGSR